MIAILVKSYSDAKVLYESTKVRGDLSSSCCDGQEDGAREKALSPAVDPPETARLRGREAGGVRNGFSIAPSTLKGCGRRNRFSLTLL